MDSFGIRLKNLRKEKGFTQKRLAEEVGLAQTTIANYEKNLRAPNHDILNCLAQLLNTSLDYLIGGNETINMTAVDLSTHKLNTLMMEPEKLLAIQKLYLEELLKGNRRKVYELLAGIIQQGAQLKDIYRFIIEPCLIEIGRQWEENQVSVGHEHYFSEETQRILAQLNNHIAMKETRKSKGLLLCTSGEGHTMGLNMINNLLEEDGWQTYFLGTNVPIGSLIDILATKDIDLVAISVTMDYHLNSAETLIKTIRNSDIPKKVKILVGGRALKYNPLLWKSIGADGFASGLQEAVQVANELIKT